MKEKEIKRLTDMVADFVGHIGKKLPDDVVAKLEELGSKEDAALPKVLYETMTKNQGLAVELDRPSCQDTGVLQFWLKCGTNFPYINELEALDVAFLEKNFGDGLLHLGIRDVHGFVPSAASVADAGQHIGDGIGDLHLCFLLI